MSASFLELFIILLHINNGLDIFIENAGFESDPIGFNNSYTYGVKIPASWDHYDPSGIMKQWSLGVIVYRGGVAYNDPIYRDGSPEGIQLSYLDTSSLAPNIEFGIEQTLTNNIVTANATYTLSAWIGNPASNIFSEHSRWGVQFYNETGFGGYRVQLAANGAILAEDDNTLFIPDGIWKQSVITTTISSNDINIGQTLQIRLIHKNIGVSNDVPPFTINFDDIQLKASYIASPTADTTSSEPTNVPSLSPTNVPTVSPIKTPTLTPIHVPSASPTANPTSLPPTKQPTLSPTKPQTHDPTKSPVANPTMNPLIVENPTDEAIITAFMTTTYANIFGPQSTKKDYNKIVNIIFIVTVSSALFVCLIYILRSKIFKVIHDIGMIEAIQQRTEIDEGDTHNIAEVSAVKIEERKKENRKRMEDSSDSSDLYVKHDDLVTNTKGIKQAKEEEEEESSDKDAEELYDHEGVKRMEENTCTKQTPLAPETAQSIYRDTNDIESAQTVMSVMRNVDESIADEEGHRENTKN